MNKPHTSNKHYRLWLFWVGVIATIAYRIIIVLNNIDPVWVKVSWYIGTIGFVWYFVHRYRVQNYREGIIRDQDLLKKIETVDWADDDKDALRYVVRSLSSSKAKWNYVVIFASSVLALIYGVITDFVL